ncbi:hypothetical protein AUP68_03191 [Ilyonectria robusta]
MADCNAAQAAIHKLPPQVLSAISSLLDRESLNAITQASKFCREHFCREMFKAVRFESSRGTSYGHHMDVSPLEGRSRYGPSTGAYTHTSADIIPGQGPNWSSLWNIGSRSAVVDAMHSASYSADGKPSGS